MGPVATTQLRRDWEYVEAWVMSSGGASRVLRPGTEEELLGALEMAEGYAAGRLSPVEVATESGEVFARGVSRYAAHELIRIQGRHSADVEAELGYAGPAAVIHRDDLVLVDPPA